MQKEHEDMIVQDQRDLQKLQQQIEKVERLRKQYFEQKQEIGSLKNTISDLKNQNQQLRSRQFLNDKSESNDKNYVKKQKSLSDQPINKQKLNKFVNNQTWKSELNGNYERTTDGQQFGTRPKLWNLSIQKNITNYTEKQGKRNFFNKQFQRNQTDCPPASLRNHSGYISTGRLLSPQLKSNKTKNKKGYIRNYFDTIQYQEQLNNVQSQYETNYISTKNKIIDNLVEDLKFDLQQKEIQVYNESNNHKQTKKILKKTLGQNEKLHEANSRLMAGYQLMQKQNQYLKQELVKQTQLKHQIQGVNQDLIFWNNTIAKRSHQEFQLQFMAMDAIYYEFQKICNSHHASTQQFYTKNKFF